MTKGLHEGSKDKLKISSAGSAPPGIWVVEKLRPDHLVTGLARLD
jgi:hypothetical protein